MDETQNETSAIPDAPEPKPVFQGDWNSATGVEKGQHSERVRQWRKREEARAEAERQRRMGAGSEQPVSRLSPDAAPPAGLPADAASRRVLEEIRDDHRALHSDRIRAAQQLIALDRGAEAQGSGESDLVTLRAILETLPVHERLAWLQGERLQAAQGDARGAAASG